MTALDRMDKLMFDPSMREWLVDHEIDLQRYLDEKINDLDHWSRMQLFMKNPPLGKAIIEDFTMDNDNKKREALDTFFLTPGGMGIIMGQVGKGKTVLGLEMLEIAHDVYRREVCMLSSELDLPEYIIQVEDPFEFKPGSVAFIDEASLTVNARDAMTKLNKEMGGLMAIRRHQDLTLLFATQHCLPVTTKIMTPNGNKKLSQLKNRDYVYSLGNSGIEEKPIIIGKTKRKRIWRITLENGTIIRCSALHKWYTDHGLVRTELLTIHHGLFKLECCIDEHGMEKGTQTMEHWKTLVKRNKEKDIRIGKGKSDVRGSQTKDKQVHENQSPYEGKETQTKFKENDVRKSKRKMEKQTLQENNDKFCKNKITGKKLQLERRDIWTPLRLPLQRNEGIGSQERQLDMPSMRNSDKKGTEERLLHGPPHRLQSNEYQTKQPNNSLQVMQHTSKLQQSPLDKGFFKVIRIEKTNKFTEMKDLTVMDNENFILENGYLTSNSKLVDLNILRTAQFFFFKELPWDEVASKQQDRGGGIDYMMMFIRMMMPTTVEQTLFTNGERWLSFSNGLPTFWNEQISKSYKKLNVEEAVKFIRDKHNAGMDHKLLIKQLRIRGWKLDQIEIEYALSNPRQFIQGFRDVH